MTAAETVALIGSLLALLGVVYSAVLSFRGGLPVGAKSLAEGFKILSDERQEQIKERDKAIASLKIEIGNLRQELIDMSAGRMGERAQMRQEIEDQSDKISRLENYINTLVGGIRILVDQLDAAGITPKWEPPNYETPRPKSQKDKSK